MTHVDWHPYPLELPDSGNNCLVTVKDKDGFNYVVTTMYMNLTGWVIDKNYQVTAWAELPEPYRLEGKE